MDIPKIDNTKDPLSQVYDLQRALLLNNDYIASNVKLANLILFTQADGNKQLMPIKREISEGDLPEFRILPSGGTPRVGRDSSSTSWQQRFEYQLATGTTDAEALMMPLTFALLCAWASWHPMFGQLTWEGRPFVQLAQAMEATQGVAIENQNRGIIGWATMWQVQVDIWLPTERLKTYNQV